MKLDSRWFRRAELALWILGVCLVGGALGATWSRWQYQAEQERALFGGPAVSAAVGARSATVPAVAASTPSATPAKKKEESAARAERVATAPRSEAVKPAARKVDPSLVGRIEIPRIGVRAMVKKGGDDKTLARAVGLVPGSPPPGQVGNAILAGHRDTFFRPLRNIKVNDEIRLVSPGETLEYRVKSVMIVGPEDTGVLTSKGVEELTLVTCYPFRFVGTAPERFIVNAVRVN